MSNASTVPAARPEPTLHELVLFGSAQANEAINLDFREDEHLKAAFTLFESVELVAARLDVTLLVCPDGRGLVCGGFIDDMAQNELASLQASPAKRLRGVARTQDVNFTVNLDPQASFGLELKAAVLGNRPPEVLVLTSGITESEHQSGSFNPDPTKNTLVKRDVVYAGVTIIVRCHGRNVPGFSSA